VASGNVGLTENFLGLSGVKVMPVVDRISHGQSNDNNNQQSLTYSQNSIVNPALLTPEQKSELIASLGGNINLSNAGVQSAKTSSINTYNFNETINENYESPKSNIPVYTVPGTYQADLSPRFNPIGLNSFVKYNVPQEKNLASYANDPLTMKHKPKENYEPMDMANLVEKPKIREDYQSCQSTTGKEYNDISQKLADQGSEVVNKLPVQPMNASSGGKDDTMYQQTDRYIFALQKSRLYSLADPIRGDIPVIPCLPNRNPSSNTWFRPNVNPARDLNAGALAVIGGPTISSTQQLIELASNATGGAKDVFNGSIVNPQTTANTAYNTETLQRAQYQSLNIGNQTAQKLDNIPAAGVYTTAFP
ncbi:MAG: hypothetical protein EBX50_21850, partial [Chitinophagia bacterium]|nr:hypothetical protein [Chitinophagia bacterium]